MMAASKQVKNHVQNIVQNEGIEIPGEILEHVICIFSGITFTPEIRGKISTVVKTLPLALAQNRDYGQQEKRIAGKITKGTQNKSISRDDLLKKCLAFHAACRTYKEDKLKNIPWATEHDFPSKIGNYRCSKIYNDRLYIKAGYDFNNCMISLDHGPRYLNLLRQGNKTLFRVDGAKGQPCLLIFFDSRTSVVDEMKGPENSPPELSRGYIKSLLKYLKLKTGNCSDAENLSISVP